VSAGGCRWPTLCADSRIQSLGPGGCEFLLAVPDGSFSESSTFLLSEVFALMPKDVLSANFGVPEDAFERIPKEQLFIFDAPVPGRIESDAIASPQGAVLRSMNLRNRIRKPTKARVERFVSPTHEISPSRPTSPRRAWESLRSP
jgi:hypothetical protein